MRIVATAIFTVWAVLLSTVATAQQSKDVRQVEPLNQVLEKLNKLEATSHQTGAKHRGAGKDATTGAPHYGLDAKALQAAFPHAVSDKNGSLQIIPTELDGLMLAAIKELSAENLKLKSVINDQHMDIENLQDQLEHVLMDKAELERELHSHDAQLKELQVSMQQVANYMKNQQEVHAGG